MALYPLATSYFGVEHVAVLEHPVLGTALSIPGVAKHAALVDVSLEPDTYTNGWRVRSDFGFLGFLDEVEAAEYPALERLKASSAQPQTIATVEVVDGEVEVAVSLGLWPWMVPVNDQTQGTALLSGGQGVLIDAAAGDLSPAQLESMGTQQFFVTLEDLAGTAVATELSEARIEVGLTDALLPSRYLTMKRSSVGCESSPDRFTCPAKAGTASSEVSADTPRTTSARVGARRCDTLDIDRSFQ